MMNIFVNETILFYYVLINIYRKMSYVKVIPSKIDVPTSMLSLLKGDKGLYLQNDIFKPTNIAMFNSKKKLFDIKEIKGVQTGISIVSPKLFIKDDSGKFTHRYRLELTSKAKCKETYRFKRPSVAGYPNGEGKCKNLISTKIVERDNEMKIMVYIDNMVYMCTEYLLLAHMCSLDYSKANDDKELISMLFKKIAPTKYKELNNLLDEAYFNIITEPPQWVRDADVTGNFLLLSEEDNKYLTLFNLIFSTRQNTKKKVEADSLQGEVITNLFGGKVKGNLYYDFIMSGQSNDILPMCKNISYEIDNETEAKKVSITDMKLMFYIKHDNSKFNPNFPESMYVKELKPRASAEILNGNKFMEMIGFGENEEQATYYSGFIWVYNSVDLLKYGKHQCHSNWVVGDIILSKSSIGTSAFSVDEDYFEDEDGEATNFEEVLNKSETTKVESADELSKALLDD